MPLDFVRYAPDVETIDPNLDRLLEQIIAFWENKVRESPVVEGSGRAVRGAHAKTFGVVKAEVQILRNVSPAYAQGIYAKPGRHGALIRFSSASNHLGSDATLGGVLGCAMKIFDVPGSKLVEDEPNSATFDLVLRTIRYSSLTRRSTIWCSRKSATTCHSTWHAARRASTICSRILSPARERSTGPTGHGTSCSHS